MTIPGGPLAKTPDSHARGLGSILGEETRSDMPQLKILYEDPVPPNKLNKS